MKTRGRIGSITRVLVFFVGMVFVFASCEKPAPPPPITTAKRPKRKAEEAQPSKKVNRPEIRQAFTYNPKGLVDPFKPFIQIGSEKKPVHGVPRTPLQEYDLSQLTLTAIVYIGDSNNRAMVRDSAGKGFTVKNGTYIGKRGGRVKAIHLDRLVIEEPVRLYGDETKTREIVMKMPREGGEK